MSNEFKIQIRKITINDFDFVYNSICDLGNETFDVNIFKEIFVENISNQNYVYLIAEIEDEKVGLISFHVQNLLHHCGLVGEIQEFYISKSYRGKGVGRSLIHKIIDFSKAHNLKSIEVTTNKKRIENVTVYEGLGFKLSHNKFTINLA